MKKTKPAARHPTPELSWLDAAAVRRAKGQARLRDRAARTDAERAKLQRRNSLFPSQPNIVIIREKLARPLR